MKKNIRMILVGQLVLFIIVFTITVALTSYGFSSIAWFIDLPSLLLILLILIPGLLIMGEWKTFIKSFSVGIKKYSLLELKNIIGAVDAAQKLTLFGALFAIIISGILLIGHPGDNRSQPGSMFSCRLLRCYY